MKELLQKRWPWLTAMAVVALAYASTFIEIRYGDMDTREVGTVEDIEALSDRNDVNLLFVLIDTLRSDHLSAWGYERKTSPTLDVLAARGIRFDRHLAQSSWTKCSMASLWTALNPSRAGITRFNHLVPEEATLAPEVLRDAGFRTVGLYRNGWVSGYFGFDQGFEVYERPVSRPDTGALKRENPTVKGGGTDADTIAAAREFLRIHGDERWFLYLHHMDVHEFLYDEETAVFGVDNVDGYDNAVLREDRVLSQVMAMLAETGHLENTVVVFASDHGEAFGERGLEGHARYVYKETTEVPFIVSLPFKLDPGVVVTSRTRNIDIWPTLFGLMGLPAMEGVDGASRLPDVLAAARGEAPPERTPGVAFLDQRWGTEGVDPLPTIAISDGPYRFIQTAMGPKVPPLEQLYSADVDTGELEDQLEAHPEVAERMRELAKGYLIPDPPPWGASETETLELDEMQLNQLRALGYAVP